MEKWVALKILKSIWNRALGSYLPRKYSSGFFVSFFEITGISENIFLKTCFKSIPVLPVKYSKIIKRWGTFPAGLYFSKLSNKIIRRITDDNVAQATESDSEPSKTCKMERFANIVNS